MSLWHTPLCSSCSMHMFKDSNSLPNVDFCTKHKNLISGNSKLYYKMQSKLKPLHKILQDKHLLTYTENRKKTNEFTYKILLYAYK